MRVAPHAGVPSEDRAWRARELQPFLLLDTRDHINPLDCHRDLAGSEADPGVLAFGGGADLVLVDDVTHQAEGVSGIGAGQVGMPAVAREPAAVILREERVGIRPHPRERESPLINPAVAVGVAGKLLGVGQELGQVGRRLGDPGLLEQIGIVVEGLRMAVEGDGVLMPLPLGRLPRPRREVIGIQAAVLQEIVNRFDGIDVGILGESVGVEDEDVGRASVCQAEGDLVVIRAPGDDLHADLDSLPRSIGVPMRVIEPPDDLLHGLPIRSGEPVPKLDGRDSTGGLFAMLAPSKAKGDQYYANDAADSSAVALG